MNENVPSVELIQKAFVEHCDNMLCSECVFEGDQEGCGVAYAYAVLTGKMKLTDSFKKEEPELEPEPKFPAWFKPGAWVMSHEGHPLAKKPMMIEDIQPDGKATLGCNGWSVWRAPEEVDPIKFRPYTFDEAKKLVGKVMEYNNDGILPVVAIIGMVTRDSFKVYYNDSSFEELQNWGATIDGIPVGVPEVDEELLKGGQE